ncbi:MAG: glycosyl transferase, group 1 [uncultured bacterium]|nr:MAG: glycosyl transferase, group 1 [uncultured bacterium]
MKILWLTWKDAKHPGAGGAEAVNGELAKRLASDGHEVIFLVSGFPGGVAEEKIDGCTVIRLGDRWSVYWKSYRYYKKNLAGWADLVIDEVNTVPFFAKYYAREKNILFVHQLCREIWFHQMFFPLNLIGYLAEPFYLWMLRDRETVTVSESSKKDLMRFGFQEEKIRIISEGIEIQPVSDLEQIEKFPEPTILSLGAVRPMKRTDHIVRAFELAKQKIPELQLIIAGSMGGEYGQKVLQMAEASPYKDSIRCLGRVAPEKKFELMRKSQLLCAAAVKEGWGLIVTEANSQGTPAVAYDVDGLRDSVKNNVTGLICEKNSPEGMSRKIQEALQNREKYATMRYSAWRWSHEITFEKSYGDFKKILNIL